MVSNLVFYQLVLIALVWLFLMLSWVWPSEPAAARPLPATPVTPPRKRSTAPTPFTSILKFFQVDITGMFRMTSCARYFKAGVGSSRPNWRWIMCFVERPKTNTSCKALVKRWSLS